MEILTTVVSCEKVLETYTFEEILELNELTEAEFLLLAVEDNLISLPKPTPVDT